MRDLVKLFLLNQRNDYQSSMQQQAAAAAERVGLRIETEDAAGRAERQREQIAAAIRGPETHRALAFLVMPVFDGVLEAAAREAVRAGIGWVLLNRPAEYVGDLRHLHPGLPIFCVTPQQKEIGEIQGLILRALLPSGGKVLSITGPLTTASARLRRLGLEESVHGSGLQIVHTHGDWTSQGGMQAVRAWETRVEGSHKHPVFSSFFPDVVVAHNDAMAQGARRALGEIARRRGWPKIADVPIVGCDGTPEFGIRLVDDGTLAATVVVPGTAATAIDVLHQYRQHKRSPDPEVQLPVTVHPDLKVLRPRAAS